MRRFNMLPNYHYEESSNGIITNPVKSEVRNYVIEGNCGKNLIPYPYAGTTKTVNGVTFTDNGDGSITVEGTPTDYSNIPLSGSNNKIAIEEGQTLTFSFNPVDETNAANVEMDIVFRDKNYKSVRNLSIAYPDNKTYTVAADEKYLSISFKRGVSGVECKGTFRPMLEIGDTATEYESYKAVGELSSNLIPYPYNETTKTINGITWTDNGDGSISVSGTNTSDGYVSFLVFSQVSRLINGVKVGDTITFSTENKLPVGIHINVNGRNSTGGQIAGITVSSSTTAKSYTIPETWVGMLIQIYVKSGATVDTVIRPQLEIGSAATDYVPYGKYKLPVVVGGKNLITYPYYSTTKTVNGVTFTDNGDGSITVNGTATAITYYHILPQNSFALPPAKYCFFDGSNGSSIHFSMQAKKKTDTGLVSALVTRGADSMFDISTVDYDYVWCVLTVQEGVTANNLVFKPMLQDITNLPNLITYPYKYGTVEKSGLTFTDNGDGSITVNGTNTGTTKVISYINKVNVSKGKYVLLGCPVGGSNDTCYLSCDIQKGSTWLTNFTEVSNGKYMDLSSYDADYAYVYIMVKPGTTVENLVFKPKLVKVSTDYEPYITPTTTNIIRDNPLKPGESISCRADKLPSVTLKKNVTNTVKVDTEIQPKSVKCQYYTY